MITDHAIKPIRTGILSAAEAIECQNQREFFELQEAALRNINRELVDELSLRISDGRRYVVQWRPATFTEEDRPAVTARREVSVVLLDPMDAEPRELVSSRLMPNYPNQGGSFLSITDRNDTRNGFREFHRVDDETWERTK